VLVRCATKEDGVGLALSKDPVVVTRKKLPRPAVEQLLPNFYNLSWDEWGDGDAKAREHAEYLVREGFRENESWDQRDERGTLLVGLNISEDDADAEGANSGFWWDISGRFHHSSACENAIGYSPQENVGIYVTTNGRFVVQLSTYRQKNEKKKRKLNIRADRQTTFFAETREHVNWACACWSREEHCTLVVGISGPPALLLVDTTSWTVSKTISIPERVMVVDPLSSSCGTADDGADENDDAWKKFHVLAVGCRNAPDGALAIVALVETDRRKPENDRVKLASLLLFRADGGNLLAETSTNFKNFASTYWKDTIADGFADSMKLLGDSIFLLLRDGEAQTAIVEYTLRFWPKPSFAPGRDFKSDALLQHARPPRWLFAIHDRLITVDQNKAVVFWDATTAGRPLKNKTVILSMGESHYIIGAWLTADGLIVLQSDGAGAEVMTIS